MLNSKKETQVAMEVQDMDMNKRAIRKGCPLKNGKLLSINIIVFNDAFKLTQVTFLYVNNFIGIFGNLFGMGDDNNAFIFFMG